ncbi:MAG: hypothetical protein IJB86_04680 [Clostridia bacterium]|nr:hypothetical protein [Clostridia bacterium]
MSETYYNADTKMHNGFPRIRKLGAVSPYGESTPFVWNGRLMRLELVDTSRGVDSDEKAYAIIRDRESGEILSCFGHGCYYYSFYQENGTAYVLGTKSDDGGLCGHSIMVFESRDLKEWTSRTLVSRDGWKFFNSSLTKGPDGYVLLLEFAPPHFNYTFAVSKDMKDWTFLSDEYTFGKGRYVGGPWMRYSNGYYYVISVEALPAQRYTNYIYRSTDLLNWQAGHYNPLLMPSEEDRKISPYAYDIDEELLLAIRTGYISSNSDVDMCEYNGKTLITYNAGNQLGFYYLAEAEYDGSEAEFLEANFN